MSRLNGTVQRAETMCFDKVRNVTTYTSSVTVPSCTGTAATQTYNGINQLPTL